MKVGDLVQLCLCPKKGRTGVVVEVVPPRQKRGQPWKVIYKVLIDGDVQAYSKQQIAQSYIVHPDRSAV